MKIIVGMSGGFDSSYTAKMLLDQGHTVIGVALKMHEFSDVSSAREAADILGIPLYTVDCRELFARVVKENFVAEYKRGRTPNPCIICNPLVKFSALAQYARENGCDAIATGHYARVVDYDVGEHKVRAIARARDEAKDQSYMLYRLPDDILEMLILPLGEYKKSELRESVLGTELATLNKKDSQEICFIPDGDYAGYIEDHGVISSPGEFINENGTVLGTHKGIIRYTLGQRKGLGISLGARAFVTKIDPDTNRITLSDSPRTESVIRVDDLVCHDSHLEAAVVKRLGVKIRYAAPICMATVEFCSDGTASVMLDAPQKSVTPGQSAVFYDGDVVVGGGIICN